MDPRPRPRVPVLLADTAIALAVGVGCALSALLGHGDASLDPALWWNIALAAPLALRRRAPWIAATLVAAECFVQWLSAPPADADAVVVLVMLYTLGAHQRRTAGLVVAGVVAELGVILAVIKWVPDVHAELIMLMATGTIAAAFLYGVYVRLRRAHLEALHVRAEAAERDRDLQAGLAVEAERSRMAREIHDIVSHSLSVMITLTDAAAAVPDHDDARHAAAQAAEVGRDALDDMQRLLGVLRDGTLGNRAPQPRIAQLDDLVAMVRSTGLPVEMTVTGQTADLGLTTELAVYRIVQEGVTNVLKHGRDVSRVQIALTRRRHRLQVTVHDDGSIDDSRAHVPGHGVTGMRERAHLHDGRLDAGPAPGGGWTVQADLPLAAQRP